MAAHTLSRINLTELVAVYVLKADVTSYKCEVCLSFTSVFCSPIRLNLGMALVCRGLITKDISVCILIYTDIGAPTRLRIKEQSGHYNKPTSVGYERVHDNTHTHTHTHTHTMDQETCRTASVSPSHKVQTNKQTNPKKEVIQLPHIGNRIIFIQSQ